MNAIVLSRVKNINEQRSTDIIWQPLLKQSKLNLCFFRSPIIINYLPRCSYHLLYPRIKQNQWHHFWPDRPTGTLRVEFNSLKQNLLLFPSRALLVKSNFVPYYQNIFIWDNKTTVDTATTREPSIHALWK